MRLQYQSVPLADENLTDMSSGAVAVVNSPNQAMEYEQETTAKPEMGAPPPYEETEGSRNNDANSILRPPTYDEVQRLKAMEAGEGSLPHYPGSSASSNSDIHFMHVSSVGGLDPESAEMAEEQLLGTDFMFYVAFAAAFIFNWIGFVLLLCFCHTIAGRTGALAGFGLSLAKWAIIVRHSTELVTDSNTWLLWLIMTLGVLIWIRATFQYFQAKREWHQLPHNARHRFFLFY